MERGGDQSCCVTKRIVGFGFPFHKEPLSFTDAAMTEPSSDVSNATCPMRQALDRIADKWTASDLRQAADHLDRTGSSSEIGG